MKLRSINKKVIAAIMAVFMIAAVSATSAFAIDPGTYGASLESTISFPPHDLDFFDGDAVVTTSGTSATVTIPLKSPAYVTVFGVTVEGYIVGAYIDADDPDYDIYNATVVNDNLVVTGPSGTDLDDFTPTITFQINRSDGTPHADSSAVLHLE
jgi:hypothetical protein